jgi:hypothetical protein
MEVQEREKDDEAFLERSREKAVCHGLIHSLQN